MSAPRLINPPMASGGGTVGGSGTPGTLPIWTAATTLGDSAIVQVAGAIATVTLTAGGAGYTSATYSQQALTGGTGSGATADIVVAGGIVTICVLRSPGTGYTAADALSCATIGAGAGFVVTVATVTTSDNTPGNLTALGRIGAGTTTPQATMESKGLIYASASGLNVAINPGFSAAPSLARANLLISSDGEPTGQMVLANVDTFAMSIYAIAQFDASALTAGKNVYGAYNRAMLTNTSAAGNMFVFAANNQASITTAAMTGKSVALMTGSGNTVTIGGVAGANTVTTIRPLSAATFIGASAAQTITSVELIQASASFTVSAHTVTNFYGLRLNVPTVSGGATITNRWGISQEDTLASNQFSAVTNTFSGIVRATGSAALAPAFSTPADTDTGMYFPSANTVRIGTGGSPGLEIDSSQNLKFNSGYGSTTTAYGCRVWINFIGATAVIRGSGGVSSLTRPSAGTYIINYTTTMPDTGYAALATKQSVASNADCQLYDLFASRTTTSSTWVNVEGAAVADSANINIAFFR